MVDLPGLFRARSGDQTLEEATVVSAMVQNYAKRPRSIILAVVSAKNDFALQEITEVARKLDPNGTRTLGLITKPDTLDAGSDSEAAYVKLAQNKDVRFRLGWHVLKNRDYEMRGASSTERDASEAEFFRQGIWAAIDVEHVGVASLRPRLSNVLRDQILQQLPSLLRDITSEIVDCDAQLQRLGTPRATVDDQRRYFFQVSREYTLLMQATVDGEYSHQFFGSAKSDEGSRRRLRARVQNILDNFAEDMRVHGQNRVLLDEMPEDEEIGVCGRYILRSDYIEEVKSLMKKSRGRELSGTFNPMIISELFKEQCKPWKGLVDKVREHVLHAIDEVTNAIVTHVAAKNTVPGILSILRNARTNSIRDLDAKFQTLLEPHLNGHPITYNHYMTDNVQKAQERRRTQELEQAFRDLVGAENFKKGKKVALYPHDMFTKLKRRTEVGMQLYAGQLATDYMEAYYKVGHLITGNGSRN
ncbi:Interferon-induced GTP-binding protein Mx3 [Beauveria bassiana]|uniref:Interferon-induced GTP-binding protein Mx3 n=1 Tax=Beauveria bassiana TaxID=176275 RepID=A0A2N6NE59_BEABA|nr:Interferon-induced GTP-binding protein Mx3 [Beauveria bassiana]